MQRSVCKFGSAMLLMVFAAAGNAGDERQSHRYSDMVRIPAGAFIMGSDLVDDSGRRNRYGNIKPWYLDEHPRHKVHLPAYYIDRYEVTNGRYRAFIAATGSAPPVAWAESGYLLAFKQDALDQLPEDRLRKLITRIYRLDVDTRSMDKAALVAAVRERLAYMDRLPVSEVNWAEANAYCRWQGKRLPSEEEWEKAARGETGHEFTWGDEWRAGMADAGAERWRDGVAPVGSYPSDTSDFGVQDLAGNVSEWVNDWYQAYPGSDYASEDFGEKFKVVRGAAFGGDGHYQLQLFQRAAYRGDFPPDGRYVDVGFRCAADVPQVTHAGDAAH